MCWAHLGFRYVFIVLYSAFSIGCLYCQENKIKVSFAPSFGITKNRVDWAISGDKNGQNPNYLSELKWNNLGIQKGIASKINYGKYGVTLNYFHSDTKKGNVVDTDFSGNNRTVISYQEQFSSNNSRNKTLVVRPEVYLKNNLSISAGYSYTYSINLLNHIEDHSSYNYNQDILLFGANWKCGHKSIIWKLEGDLMFAKYIAKGDWKLRPDLAHPVSFSHKMDMYGLNVNTDLIYMLNKAFNIKLGCNLNYLYGKNGKDTIYYFEGGSVDTRLKYARITSSSLSTGIVYIL